MYRITQEQEILRDTVRDFAKTEIVPLASSIDWDAKIPDSLISKLPSLGLFGVSVPGEQGGVGADFLSAVIVAEEVSRASGSLGALLSIHNCVVCEALRMSANATLTGAILPKLASGTLGAYVPAQRSSVSCKIEGSVLRLDGEAEYVLGADRAGVFLVDAVLESSSPKKQSGRAQIAFAKDDAMKGGLRVGEPKRMLGMRASGAASVSFEELQLPISSLLFDVSTSLEVSGKLTDRARLATASQALGLSQAALDAEVKYANERSQFNTKIGRFYAVQDFIAMDATALETSRAITYLAASQMDASESCSRDCAIAKISSSNCAVSASRHAIRIHGGYGFIRDYPVERYLRDARFTQIYHETNEALKECVASSVLGYSG